jgi:putative ABC transport system permease protein
MSFIDVIRRSLRSLLSAKTRTLLTAFAIAVGAFALTLTLGASKGAQGYADTILENNFDPSELIVSKTESLFDSRDTSEPQEYNESFGSISNPSGTSTQVEFLDDADLAQISEITGVSSVRPNITVAAEYITRDGYRRYVSTLEGFDPFTNPDLAAGEIPEAIPDGNIILPLGFLNALGFDNPEAAIGKTIRIGLRQGFNQQEIVANALQNEFEDIQQLLSSQQQTQEREFKIIAVRDEPSALAQPGTELYLYTNQSDIKEMYEFTNEGSAEGSTYLIAFVKVENGKDPTVLEDVQNRIEGVGYSAQSLAETQEFITQFIDVLQGIVTVFGLIAIVASVFGVINTMYISVLQRTREIGLMKALGMRKRTVNLLFLLEAAAIGFLGGVIGALTAIVAGIFFNPLISDQLNLGDVYLIDFDAMQISALVLTLTLVAISAGLFPARKAAKLDPINALRTE